MKIWVIGRNYPLPENGMQGSFELEQAKMLSRYGHEVYYLACCLHPVKHIKHSGYQTWKDEEVTVCTYSSFFVPRIYPFYFVKIRTNLWEQFFKKVEGQAGVPDVIHIHYPAMLMIADALKEYKNKKVKIVATEHWTKVLAKKLDSIEMAEYRKYCLILEQLICVGLPLRNAVKELINYDGIVIPNIVNAFFCPSAKTHEGFRFVAVGRLTKVKQFDMIIKAFHECFYGKMDITLTIIGGGEEKDRLQRIIEEKQASEQIRLMGSLNRKETAEVVSNSDCLVCYSRFETFGVPIIEAWACGLPVISTTAAAVTDIYDERLGFEITPDDFERLKESMIRIWDNIEKYDKKYIANYANTHYAEDIIYKKLLDIYQQ